MMDYKSEIQDLKRRVEALEKCKHDTIVCIYTDTGYSNRCRKCDEEISFQVFEKPDFNNYEVG